MKYRCMILSTMIFLIIPQLLYSQTIGAPTSAEQLLKQFKEAVKAKDKEAVMRLVNWEGVSNEMKILIQGHFDPIFQMEVKDIKLTSLPADFKSEHVLNGVRYHPNVDVIGYINIKLAQGRNSMEPRFPYGKKDNVFYLAGTITEKVYEPKTKEKSLSVTVIGLTYPKPVSFTGTCVYLKDEKEIKRNISGNQGNLNRTFWGNFIKSCKVQNNSDFGWIQLIISEDGKTIFESEKMKTNDPIIYERN